MLIFAHAGITLGSAVILNRIFLNRRCISIEQNISVENGAVVSNQDCRQSKIVDFVKKFIDLDKRIDIRILILGSLLPDIIDKPIGIYLFKDTFSTGRIFSHTLLFFLLMSLCGLYIYRKYRLTWGMVISFGVLMHLILDQMWISPRTFYWPLRGFDFEVGDYTEWASSVWDRLFNNPATYIPEIIGAVILCWFTLAIIRTGHIQAFIKSGRII